ncbi:MAG TPA: phosphotransferase [Candidatus Limnocylindrales bacterium]|nr:phosphotransferase [Candidatus Limnocylindrales bacterium]
MLGYAVMDFLEGHGVVARGPIEVVKERPWSLVAKVPTACGLLWFKENRGQTLYEAPLLLALARWAPRRVLEVVAIDAGRGWSVTRDGGPTLREMDAEPDLARWERMLADHADFQRFLGVHAQELLSLGVPDQRPSLLPQLLDTFTLPPAVATYRPVLKQLCEELAASPVPLSLQHDDLHDANVFADGRVFDWGDSSVSHPFGVLLVSLRAAAQRFGDASVVPRLRDAYLEPWTSLAPRARLLREVELAVQVSKVGRALSWRRAVAGSTPQQYAPWGETAQYWLQELLK